MSKLGTKIILKSLIKPCRGLKITQSFFLLFNLVPQGTSLVSLPFPFAKVLVCSLFCNEHLFAFIALQTSFPSGHELSLVKDMSKSILLGAFIFSGFPIQRNITRHRGKKNLLPLSHYRQQIFIVCLSSSTLCASIQHSYLIDQVFNCRSQTSVVVPA